MLDKLNLFCLTDWSNNSVAIDLIKDGSVLERKSSLKILGLSFFSKLDWNLDSFFDVSFFRGSSLSL